MENFENKACCKKCNSELYEEMKDIQNDIININPLNIMIENIILEHCPAGQGTRVFLKAKCNKCGEIFTLLLSGGFQTDVDVELEEIE